MSKHLFLFGFLWISMNLHAQSLVGQKVPDFQHLQWIQQPQSLTSFNPQFVVIEFWATWCSPCLANLKHLNELSTQLESKQVACVSITDEAAR